MAGGNAPKKPKLKTTDKTTTKKTKSKKVKK